MPTTRAGGQGAGGRGQGPGVPTTRATAAGFKDGECAYGSMHAVTLDLATITDWTGLKFGLGLGLGLGLDLA